MTGSEVRALSTTEINDAIGSILGGKSEFSIINTNSGTTFKYRVNVNKKDTDMFFVRVADKSVSYQYAGFLRKLADGTFKYVQGKRGMYSISEAPIRGITYAMNKGHNPLPRPMIMVHHGKCARCGKSLDDVESVRRGFGPVCWDKVVTGKGFMVKEGF